MTILNIGIAIISNLIIMENASYKRHIYKVMSSRGEFESNYIFFSMVFMIVIF